MFLSTSGFKCFFYFAGVLPHSKLRKVLFLVLSVTFLFLFVFLFVNQISRKLNRFAQNSQGRRVWSLAATSFNVKVKGQGHQRQKHAGHSHHPWQRRNGTHSLQTASCGSRRDHCVAARGVISAACMQCMLVCGCNVGCFM